MTEEKKIKQFIYVVYKQYNHSEVFCILKAVKTRYKALKLISEYAEANKVSKCYLHIEKVALE